MRNRTDDALDRFVVRWKDFDALTMPVARYYLEKGLVVRVAVDRERDVTEVSGELKHKLDEYFARKN